MLSSVIPLKCPLIVTEFCHYKEGVLCFNGFIYSLVGQLETLQLWVFFFGLYIGYFNIEQSEIKSSFESVNGRAPFFMIFRSVK